MFTTKMKDNFNILPFFTDPDKPFSRAILNKLIEHCHKIAVRYLQLKRFHINKILINQQITVQELATDCIAGLFSKDNLKNIYTIQNCFNSWQPQVITEEDCNYFLNKIVASRVEQHLIILFKDDDPFFSKILDSVNYLIRHQNFFKMQYLGKTYIVKTEDEHFEKQFISTEEFDRLPLNLFLNKTDLLISVFNYLENETDYNNAIPLNDLVNKLKHLNFEDYLTDEYVTNEYKKIEINEILDSGYSYVVESILNNYADKNKLTAAEKEAFALALKDMAIDLSDGGVNIGLYNYLSPYLKNLDAEFYKSHYHNMLEYLFKVMRNKIGEIIKQND